MILENFDRLVRDSSPALLDYIARRVDPPHDAADVLAETLLTAYRKIRAVPNDPQQATFWLFAVARRQLANYHRGKVSPQEPCFTPG
ncbi:RNA polymerase sigma factor [Arthrobacter psychrolactophilus]